MKAIQKVLAFTILSMSASVFAAPLPASIVVEDKAVVPVLKTEVIRKAAGQEPVREVQATVFEVTNNGKDIVAREIQLQDNQAQFSDKKLSAPVIKKGGVIVPTSKVEVNKTVKQDGQVLLQMKSIDAEGVEFKKGQEPVKRTLQVEQAKLPESKAKVSHAVITNNGAVTKDVTVLSEDE
ncbi:hypothetical protein KXJ74_16150 [Acinetobacter johnsonii]|nr:hypothetical protein KXJ74_16150 [Acinetobacter johnsonii]